MKRSEFPAQSLIEFAIAIPLIALIIMGALDLGRAYVTKIILNNAAREGAYYLSYHPADQSNCSGGVCYQGTIQVVQNETNSFGVAISPADVVANNCCTTGNPVEVSVSNQVNLAIFRLIYGPVTLTGRARMLVQ